MGLVLAFALWCAFWKLGSYPVAEWDEARYGVHSVEMLENGDYVNYTYNQAPEFWTAKPPLAVWLQTLSYRLLGKNEWALRLPSALAGLLTLLFVFLICRLFMKSTFVWWVVLMAASSRALFGFHVARNGDTDALLVLFLTMFAYFLIRSLRENAPGLLWWGALAFGSAFMSKGLALLFFVPGATWAIWTYRREWFSSPKLWAPVGVFILFPLLWGLAILQWGNRDPSASFSGTNAFSVMFFLDVWDRFRGIGPTPPPYEPWFLPITLDLRFSSWFHLLVLGLVTLAGLKLYRKKVAQNDRKYFASGEEPSLFFLDSERRREAVAISLGFVLPMYGMLFASHHKLEWYVSPSLVFFFILLVAVLDRVDAVTLQLRWPRMRRVVSVVFLCATLGSIANQVNFIAWSDESSVFRDFVRKEQERLSKATSLQTSRVLRQDEMLYLKWVRVGKIDEGACGGELRSGIARTSPTLECSHEPNLQLCCVTF